MEQREALDAELGRARRRDRRARGPRSNELQATIADAERRDRRRDRGERRERGPSSRRTIARVRSCATTSAAGRRTGRGRGPARRHDVPGLPPLDPVDGSRADPQRPPGEVVAYCDNCAAILVP